MDPFKNYLQQHRHQLDSDVPDDAAWQRIQESLVPSSPKKFRVIRLWPYATAACLLLCAVLILLPKKQPEDATAAKPGTILPLQLTTKTSSPIDSTIVPHEKVGMKNSYAKNDACKRSRAPKKFRPFVNPAFLQVKEVEQNYAQLVNSQLEQLRLTPVYAESPEYFGAFQQQYKQIGSDEAIIRNDIQRQGLNDELLQQLINVNQQKLNVLKDLQAEIEKLNRKVQLLQSPQGGSRSFYLTI